MTHKEKLLKAFSFEKRDISFEDWLIEESERNHKKSIQMAGDLGKALER